MAKKDIIATITAKYEQLHVDNINRVQRNIKQIYMSNAERAVLDIIKPKAFRISPIYARNKSAILAIRKRINESLKGFTESLTLQIENGIDKSWEMSISKRMEIAEARFPGISDTLKDRIADPRKKALEAFKKRKTAGMNLSDRIWREEQQFRELLEDTVKRGIADGIPGNTLARQTQEYLKDPNKLFRRVRSNVYDPSTGGMKLVESKPMKAYKPGQGVYKSSYMNSRRMAVTEINIANRTADHLAWESDPLVKGIRVNLSDKHPEPDVCDSLAGVYPRGYKHVGFHPHCLCYVTPELVNDKEYEAIEDAILAGEYHPVIARVSDIPEKAKAWYKKNADSVARLSNTPYFIADNEKFVKKYLKA